MEKVSTEEKITTAAIREFSQYGMAGARIDRIAKNARINKAMIYYHFKGKEDLYEKVLSETIRKVYTNLRSFIPEDKEPLEQIYTFLGKYLEFINSIDRDFIRVMLREISSGGKYFRKIALPGLIAPMFTAIMEVFRKAREQGKLRDIKPEYTFFQIVGSILFFNAMKMTLEGTEIHRMLYGENHLNDFTNNLIGILKEGIEKREAL